MTHTVSHAHTLHLPRGLHLRGDASTAAGPHNGRLLMLVVLLLVVAAAITVGIWALATGGGSADVLTRCVNGVCGIPAG